MELQLFSYRYKCMYFVLRTFLNVWLLFSFKKQIISSLNFLVFHICAHLGMRIVFFLRNNSFLVCCFFHFFYCNTWHCWHYDILYASVKYGIEHISFFNRYTFIGQLGYLPKAKKNKQKNFVSPSLVLKNSVGRSDFF